MSVINEIKTLLGMEVKLAQMKLEDGVTVIEAEAFEPKMGVFIVNGEERVPMPVGEFVLEDGNVMKVEEVGIIAAIESPEEEMPANEEEVASPAEEEQQMEAAPSAPKKIVKSVTEEQFFSAIEELKKEIAELKLSKDKSDEDLKSVEVKEVELSVEPLTHSPEIKPATVQKFASSRPLTTQDRVMAKLFK